MTTPKMIAAGRSSIVFSSVSISLPNLTAPESEKDRGESSNKLVRIAKVNVAHEVDTNTLHNILNVQKVLGDEIS